MYICKHCGYVSRNENINYCNNIKCGYYGYCDDGREDDGDEAKSKQYEKNNVYMQQKPKAMPYYEGEGGYMRARKNMPCYDGMNLAMARGTKPYEMKPEKSYEMKPDTNNNYACDKNKMNYDKACEKCRDKDYDMNCEKSCEKDYDMSCDKGYDKPCEKDYGKNYDNGYGKGSDMDSYMRKPGMKPDKKAAESCGMLGFAAVPMQRMDGLYPLKEALAAGTIFPELHMPYDKKIIRRG